MLDDVLRKAFAAARQHPGLIILDILWKAVWLIATIAALFLLAAWFGSGVRSIAWPDTGVTGVNAWMAATVFREWWASHKMDVSLAFGGAIALSIAVWFVLEAFVRSRFVAATALHNRYGVPDPLPPSAAVPLSKGDNNGESRGAAGGRARRISCAKPTAADDFKVYLLSSLAKYLILGASVLILAMVWRAGAPLVAIVVLATIAFFLTLLDTLIRSDAVDLLGTDLIRVTGLIGILVSFETMVGASCAVILIAGFLHVARLMDAMVMLGAAGVCIVILNLLHTYLLLVRFSAVEMMRRNVVEV